MDDQLRFVTFYIKGFLFGLDIFSVGEINKQLEFSKVPLSESSILGLVNLRGQIVTTIDTSEVLGMEQSEITDKSKIIILKLDQKSGILKNTGEGEIYALLVDEIGDIIDTYSNKIEEVPSNLNVSNANLEVRYINNIIKLENKILMLLDLKELFRDTYEK